MGASDHWSHGEAQANVSADPGFDFCGGLTPESEARGRGHMGRARIPP